MTFLYVLCCVESLAYPGLVGNYDGLETIILDYPESFFHTSQNFEILNPEGIIGPFTINYSISAKRKPRKR